MNFFKIILSGVLSFYLVFGLVAGILAGPQLSANAQSPRGSNPTPSAPSPASPGAPKPTTVPAAKPATTPAGKPAEAARTPVKPLGVDLEGALGFNACNISGQAASSSTDALQVCVRSILQFALTMAGILAIIQLGIAAFNYFNPSVSEDVIKQSIETIRNIFIGLMLIAAPVVILRTFNVSLTNFGFLGFSASSGGSAAGGSTGGSAGSTSSSDTKVVGGVPLSPTDTAANIENVTKAIEKLKTGETTKEEVAKAVEFLIANIDPNNPNVDIEAAIKVLNLVQAAGVPIDLPANLAAQFNNSGTKPDGIQTVSTASYCSLDGCEIRSAKVNSPNSTTQILGVTLKNKNGNPTDYILTLRPVNSIPSPLSGFMSLTPSTTGGNPTITITKKSITGPEFTQWCSTATAQAGSNGGAACLKSPASSNSVIYGPVDTR